MKLSLGNQRYEEFNNIIHHKDISLDIRVSQLIVIINDVMCSLLFLGFLVLWRIKSDETVEEMISEDVLPSYYTLQIRALPPSFSYSEITMKKHFEKFGGQVAQISTVYDYDVILSEVKSILKKIDEYTCTQGEERL